MVVGWTWQTYVYVPGAAPASEIIHEFRMSLWRMPKLLASLGGAIVPESDTVPSGPGWVTSETPLPPSNSTSSGRHSAPIGSERLHGVAPTGRPPFAGADPG